MKHQILLLADLHIHKTDKWHLGRITALTERVMKLGVDEVFVIGDLFDNTRPTPKAINMVHQMFSQWPPVSLLNGNHERVGAGNYILNDLSVPLGATMLPRKFTRAGIMFQAFGHGEIKQIVQADQSDILLSHFRWAHSLYGKGELPDESVVSKYKDVFLGDIHVQETYGDNVHYTGSPWSTQYSKTGDYGGILLTIEDQAYTWKWIQFDLPREIVMDIPYTILGRTLDGLRDADRHKTRVACRDNKELSAVKKIRAPDNVLLLPEILKGLQKVAESAPQMGTDIFETIMVNLPKRLRERSDAVSDLLRN